MEKVLEILVGGFTLGLPIWFVFLDRRVRPRVKRVGEGDSPPLWGRMVIVVGAGLAVLIALAAPLSDFNPGH
jgi:hypothetical protein